MYLQKPSGGAKFILTREVELPVADLLSALVLVGVVGAVLDPVALEPLQDAFAVAQALERGIGVSGAGRARNDDVMETDGLARRQREGERKECDRSLPSTRWSHQRRNFEAGFATMERRLHRNAGDEEKVASKLVAWDFFLAKHRTVALLLTSCGCLV